MTALKVTLDAPLDRFVEDQVASGAYPDAQAVVRAGLDRLRDDQQVAAVKAERFKTLVQVGLDDMKAGRFETVDDVDGWLDGLGRRPPT